jgi:hypothetical protein
MRTLALLLILFFVGCNAKTQTVTPAGPLNHAHAAALITKYSSLVDAQPVTPDEPNVGDKCPQCNDPPGKCGVGKVGDGVVCDTCPLCKGDGKIDERDLQAEPQALKLEETPKPTKVEPRVSPEVTSDKKIVWYYKPACPPCEQWEREVYPIVIKNGWTVEKVLDQSNPVPNFEIQISNKKYRYRQFLPLKVLNALN